MRVFGFESERWANSSMKNTYQKHSALGQFLAGREQRVIPVYERLVLVCKVSSVVVFSDSCVTFPWQSALQRVADNVDVQ